MATTSAALQALCAACEDDVTMFAYWLPKVELHAHLNGSISMALLRHLAKRKGELALASTTSDGVPISAAVDGSQLSMEDDALGHIVNPKDRMAFCFQVFDRVYQIMDNLAFTRLAVQDACLHYAAEHTVWLELRTSLRDGLRCDPRPGSDVVTQEAYLTTVQDTLAALVSGSALYDWNTGMPIDVTSDSDVHAWKAQLNEVYATTAMLPRGGLDAVRRWLPTPTDGFSDGPASSDATTTSMPSPAVVFDRIVRPNLLRMQCCLTVSVSRSLSIAAAHGTVAVVERLLARQQRSRGAPAAADAAGGVVVPITSIDFSGNCYKQRFSDFEPLLRQLRAQWALGITLHAGEKEDDEELQQMMRFDPDRWGHLVFASAAHRAAIGQSVQRRPIELCPSSNLLTCGHARMDQHHMNHHWKVSEYLGLLPSMVREVGSEAVDGDASTAAGDRRVSAALSETPISINTDDRGVFGTSMTEELLMVASLEDVRRLAPAEVQRLLFVLQRRAIEDAFVGSDALRQRLAARFDDACAMAGRR